MPETPTTSPTPPERPERQKRTLQASQNLDRQAPLTAAGTRMRQRDQANEWVAYTMVVLITVLIGNLGERLYDQRNNIDRSFPPELIAALDQKSSGGRLEANPVTGEPRLPDDEPRERELLAQLNQDPENVDTLRALAGYYYDTLQADKAIVRYQQVLEQEPDNVAIMRDLAHMQFTQGEMAMARGVLPKDMTEDIGAVAAVATLMEITVVDHAYGPAWVDLGWAYMQIGQRQKAIEAFTHALEHTEDSELRHGLEQQLAQLQQQSQAPVGAPGSETELNPLTGTPVLPHDHAKEASLDQQIADNPSDPAPHLLAGHYYYDTFQPELSVHHYQAYLDKGGEASAAVLTDLATVMSAVDEARALQMLESIAKDHPDFAPAWNNMAHLRFQAGDTAGAITAMQKAYALAGDADKSTIASVLRQWGAEIPAS